MKTWCDMDLQLYPFDTQTCYIEVTLQSASTKYLRFQNAKVRFIGCMSAIQSNLKI